MRNENDAWIGKQVRIKKSNPLGILSGFDFTVGRIGIIERYATTNDIDLSSLTCLNDISLPPCIFALKVEGYATPIFAPIEFLEIVE